MARGIELDDKKKETIKALLSTGIAKNQVAIKAKVSWASVDKVSKEAPDEIANMREHKRNQFIDRLWNSMDKALGLGDKRIELALDANEKLEELKKMISNSDLDYKQAQELKNAIETISTIPLGQISTYIGTIYDKHALMTGGKTANVGVKLEDYL